MSDAEERELIDSSGRGEWTTAGNIEERKAFWREAAKGVLGGKRERISISIPERDLARLKARAVEEGCLTRRSSTRFCTSMWKAERTRPA